MQLSDISHHWLFESRPNEVCGELKLPYLDISLFIFKGRELLLLQPQGNARSWTVPSRRVEKSDQKTFLRHVYNMLQHAIEERRFHGVQLLDTTTGPRQFTLDYEEDFSTGLKARQTKRSLSIMVSLTGSSFEKGCVINHPTIYTDFKWIQPRNDDGTSNIADLSFENVSLKRLEEVNYRHFVRYPKYQASMLYERPDTFHDIAVSALTGIVRAFEIDTGVECLAFAMVAVKKGQPGNGVFLMEISEEQWIVSKREGHRVITQKYPVPDSGTVSKWEYAVYDIVGIVVLGHLACNIPPETLRTITTPEGRVKAEWMQCTHETKLTGRSRQDSTAEDPSS